MTDMNLKTLCMLISGVILLSPVPAAATGDAALPGSSAVVSHSPDGTAVRSFNLPEHFPGTAFPGLRETADPSESAVPEPMRGGSITWTCEDWNGSYGAIASSTAVTADGSRIYVGWELNYEHVAAFDGTGDGTPLWEYDLLEENKFNIDGTVQVLVSADGQVMAAGVTGRSEIGGTTQESFVIGLNIDTGEEVWRYTTPPTVQNPDQGEWLGPIAIASDGNRIACCSYGYRQDPVFEPVFITILDGDGQELHRIELPDPANDIMYLNDLRLTADGMFLAADFRMNSNPSHKITVWNLTDYSERASWTVNNSPPQGQIGLSDDGVMLAIGDLQGKIRVYRWTPTDSRGEYVLAWTYTIPPDYYYPWVVGLAVSPDGSRVAAGSYQANQTTVKGYLYLFDTDIGPSSRIQSSNFGGMVTVVAFSADGSVVAGSGYGPYPENDPGYDLIAMDAASGAEIYRMAGATPGSLQDCALNADGTRLTCGGKRVHAYQFGSGGLAYSVALDMTPQPTQTPTAAPPTATPVPTQTPTEPPSPTPSPTPSCSILGCKIEMPSLLYHNGDTFYCNVRICNPDSVAYPGTPVFMILDVYGMLFFAPDFNEFDYYLRDVIPGETIIEILPAFSWPPGSGSASGIHWYAGMTNPSMTELFGELDMVTWGWE